MEVPMEEAKATTQGIENVTAQKAPDKQKALQLKVKGNQAWKAGDMGAAISSYSEAIEYDPTSAELYRNRSAAYAVVKEWKRAVDDADYSIELDNSAKSHCRKAEAYFNWGIQQKDPEILELAVRSFDDAYRIEVVREIKNAVEQTSYYLTWMRAERALQLSALSIPPKEKA